MGIGINYHPCAALYYTISEYQWIFSSLLQIFFVCHSVHLYSSLNDTHC